MQRPHRPLPGPRLVLSGRRAVIARRESTPEFKREAVRLVRGASTTYAQVRTDLGVDKSIIRDRHQRSEAGKLEVSKAPGAGSRSVEEENAALRREAYRFIHREEANHSVPTLCEF